MKRHDVPLDRIRVASVLARYPVHHLARQGGGPIEVREVSASGDLTVTWKVEHDGGPLAYQIDTLIVNRRIDEAPRPIPALIWLGPLREIARELGLDDRDTTLIRDALDQNAKVFIRAKVKVRCEDGSERWMELGSTRYGVILTGQKLPDGRKAGGVYLELHGSYREILNNAQRRPLDYDYLRRLEPAAQRLYELLSYPMYAALKLGKPHARMSYAEFCMLAPLKRYDTAGEARRQLKPTHTVHRDMGYIVGDVEFEPARDRQGRPDWTLVYAPGPRAKAEFRAFTTRLDAPIQLPLPLESPAPEARARKTPPAPEPLALDPLAAELVARGVTTTTAVELVRTFAEERIRAHLAAFDWLVGKKHRSVARNAPGYLVKSIQDDYAPPDGFVAQAQRAARAESERATAAAIRADRARTQAEQAQVESYWAGLSPEEQAALEAEALEQADPETRAHCSSRTRSVRALSRRVLRDAHIRRRLGLPSLDGPA